MFRYCADTSSLVAAWVERYPPDNFPGFWTKVGEMITAGQLFAPDEVRNELNKRSKEVVEWLNQFEGFFFPTDEDVLDTVSDVLGNFPRLVMAQKVAFAADPFVISLAKINGATVLTEEGPGSVGKPKIPLVCQHYRVECCNLLDLIRAKRWVVG